MQRVEVRIDDVGIVMQPGADGTIHVVQEGRYVSIPGQGEVLQEVIDGLLLVNRAITTSTSRHRLYADMAARDEAQRRERDAREGGGCGKC
jgi:hypothetical protein